MNTEYERKEKITVIEQQRANNDNLREVERTDDLTTEKQHLDQERSTEIKHKPSYNAQDLPPTTTEKEHKHKHRGGKKEHKNKKYEKADYVSKEQEKDTGAEDDLTFKEKAKEKLHNLGAKVGLLKPETHTTIIKEELNPDGTTRIITEERDHGEHVGLGKPETEVRKTVKTVDAQGNEKVTTKEGRENVGFLTTPESHKTKTKVEQDDNGKEKIVTERKDNPQHHGLYLPETSKVKTKEVVEPDGSRVIKTKEGTEHSGLATHPETHKTIAKVEAQPDGTQIIDKKSRFNEEQMGLAKPVTDQVRTKEVVDPYGQKTVLETKEEQLRGGKRSDKTKDSTDDQYDDKNYDKEGKHHHKGLGHHHDSGNNDTGVVNRDAFDRNNRGLGYNDTGVGNRDPLDRNNKGLGNNNTGVDQQQHGVRHDNLRYQDPPVAQHDSDERGLQGVGLGYNDTGLGNRDPLDRNNKGLGNNNTGVGNRNPNDTGIIGQGYNDTGVGYHDPSLGQQSYSNTGIEPGFGNRDAGFGNRDAGLGNRDAGFGNRDAGFGNRDAGFGKNNTGVAQQNTNLEQQPYAVKTTFVEKTKYQEGNLTGETPKAHPA